MNLQSILIVYSLFFLIFFILIYYIFEIKGIEINDSNTKKLLVILLGIGFFMRLWVGSLFRGYFSDINDFQVWAFKAANDLKQVYSGPHQSDYPPLYIYFLYLIGKFTSFHVISNYTILLLKLPSILADVIAAYFFFKLSGKYLSKEKAIIIAAFYLFNSAVFINSTIWGQVDSFFTLIIISAIFLLSENKLLLSLILFTSAVLMKPQGVIFLPVLFFEILRQKSLKNFVKPLLSALAFAVIIILPFSLDKNVFWIFKLYFKDTAKYPFASANAFNLFTLLGQNYRNDGATFHLLSYYQLGIIFIVIVTLISFFIYLIGDNQIFASAAALLQISGVFTFSCRMHERYIFPAVALSILSYIYIKDKRILLFIVGYSITAYINSHYVLFNPTLQTSSVHKIISVINILLYICLVIVFFDIVIKRSPTSGGDKYGKLLLKLLGVFKKT